MNQEEKQFYKELDSLESYRDIDSMKRAGYNYKDDILFESIKDLKIDSLPSNIYWDGIGLYDSEKNYYYSFEYLTVLRKSNSEVIFYLDGEILPDKWNIEFIYPIFKEKLKQTFDEHNETLCTFDYDEIYYFHIKVYVSHSKQFETINNILETNSKKIDLVHSLTFVEASKQNFLQGEVNLKFKFPKHLKALCNQYLSYFGKFLADHKIECELSLIEKDDITYMTIDVDKFDVNIDELHQALAGYFSLPVVAQENIVFNNQNIATQQLIANIEHLKSQLRLANLTIAQYENNNAINIQRPVEYVLIDSLDEESKLKLFDGLIKVGQVIKLKFLGIDIEFDMPLLIDKVKRRQKDND